MNKNSLISEVTDCAEKQGWTVDVEDEDGLLWFTFSKYSPAGQDFSFTVEVRNSDMNELIKEVEDYYESFDVDYETSLWIDADGHGRKGAPYHIKDLVKDMESVEKMIGELSYALDRLAV